MATLTDKMFILLRSSLNQRPADISPFSDEEWQKLFWLARKHGIVTIINDAIDLLPEHLKPQGDIALSWTLSAERTRYHYAHQKEVLQQIDEKAKAEGLPYVLLKGMSLARFYPRPDSRPCGDIDILFPQNFERGNALLGFPDAKAVGKHAEMKIDGVTIENHRQLLDLNYDSQRRAEAYIMESLRTVPDDHFLPPMANMVYLLMHTVSHLTARNKLPLRNVIDWGMFLRANREMLNPDECISTLKRIGTVHAFSLFTQLAAEYTDTDFSMFIKEHVPAKDVTRMNDLIVSQSFVEAVPKDMPFIPRTIARLKRRSQRRWMFPYLPASFKERLKFLKLFH
ncbi:MAG: nucleotidyltransferase family protein [Bacteroidales bacterium]|nr:nucleotidyltransferase family protein [Bacteroidales bacterium]